MIQHGMNSWGFVVTKKGTLGCVLEVSEFPWEFAKKSLLKWATQKKKLFTFLRSEHGKFVLNFCSCS
jgi:hypothetical protein